VEGVDLPGVGVLELPALEEHDRDVDVPVAGLDDTLAETAKVLGVKGGQVEPGLPVGRRPGPGATPGVGAAELDTRGLFVGPPRRLPSPEAEEVVAVPLQEVEVGVVVEGRRGVLARRPPVAVLLEVATNPLYKEFEAVNGYLRAMLDRPPTG
jgi:hypothetical protein